MSIDKLDLSSPDLVNENFNRLATLFPNCVTEGADGKVIDFDLLKQELNHAVVDGNQERYRLEWPGKKESIVTANLPTNKTLRPIRQDSVDFDNTENIYIEGDNLEVLKLLQESYLGKIKLIYIDPPYNTGNDFVYKDNFTQDKNEYKAESGLVDEYQQRLFLNPETAGRYHSNWLSMMYPRLKLARNLLTDDGVIFISIDDTELHGLKKICDEIFGESNFIANIIWERAYSPVNLKKHFSENHDHILCYSKDHRLAINHGLKRSQEANARYINPDCDPRGVWKPDNFSVGPAVPEKVYEIITPSGRRVSPPNGRCWLLTQSRFKEFLADKRIWFGNDGTSIPSLKRFLNEVKDSVTPVTIWKYSEVGHSQEASQFLKKLFGDLSFFDHPKPVELIKRCIELYSDCESIILDFFAGSSTTAHAVMQLNAREGSSKKFILIQLPELTAIKSDVAKHGFKNIYQIGEERIRLAAAKIKLETGAIIDYGFRVYRLDESNMEDVYYQPHVYSQANLNLFADNIKPDRTHDDLLAQIMLAWGLPLSLKIKQELVAGKQVFKVDENSLFACFDSGIDENFAKEIAGEKPLRIVFRDSGFADDTAKINVRQLLKQLSPDTEMKAI